MKAETIAKYFSELNPDEEILIEWFEQKDVEAHLNSKLDEDTWSLAVHLFEKSSDVESYQLNYFVNEAKERLEASK